MRCRYMHDFIGMRCVDENYDSLEDDMNEYDIYEDRESHSQEGEITVKKVASSTCTFRQGAQKVQFFATCIHYGSHFAGQK